MSVRHRYDRGVVELALLGAASAADLRASGTAAMASPGVELPTPVLIDLSGAGRLSRGHVQGLVAAAELFEDRVADITRVAILSPSRTVRSLLKVAQRSASKRVPVKTFGERQEALAWLGRGA